jgi:hypothetical protein
MDGADLMCGLEVIAKDNAVCALVICYSKAPLCSFGI